MESFYVDISTLKQKNPLLGRMHGCFYTQKDVYSSCQPIAKDHPSYTDEGLSLILTAFKFFREPTNEKTLKLISGAVREREPLTSVYYIEPTGSSQCLLIRTSENPTPALSSIKKLLVNSCLLPVYNDNTKQKKHY